MVVPSKTTPSSGQGAAQMASREARIGAWSSDHMCRRSTSRVGRASFPSHTRKRAAPFRVNLSTSSEMERRYRNRSTVKRRRRRLKSHPSRRARLRRRAWTEAAAFRSWFRGVMRRARRARGRPAIGRGRPLRLARSDPRSPCDHGERRAALRTPRECRTAGGNGSSPPPCEPGW